MSAVAIPRWLDAGARFSPDRIYRYSLWREWDSQKPHAAFCMLNPSTADEATEDPTIRKCLYFARTWGFGSLEVVNLFAFRATDPQEMKAASEPIGLANDAAILSAYHHSSRFVVAWGNDGAIGNRGATVLAQIGGETVWHLGRNLGTCGPGTGHPKHPLYLKNATDPTPICAAQLAAEILR